MANKKTKIEKKKKKRVLKIFQIPKQKGKFVIPRYKSHQQGRL